MTQSSTTHGTDGLGSLVGLSFAKAAKDWGRGGAGVRGPLLTVAAAVTLDVLARQGVAHVYPFPVLLLTVAVGTVPYPYPGAAKFAGATIEVKRLRNVINERYANDSTAKKMVGKIRDATHSMVLALGFLAVSMTISGVIVLTIRPDRSSAGSARPVQGP